MLGIGVNIKTHGLKRWLELLILEAFCHVRPAFFS